LRRLAAPLVLFKFPGSKRRKSSSHSVFFP
jgi:hypothetical protein